MVGCIFDIFIVRFMAVHAWADVLSAAFACGLGFVTFNVVTHQD